MGTVIALGGGRFDNGEMLDVARHIVEKTGKEHPYFVFVPAAGSDDISGDEHLLSVFSSLGCVTDVLFLLHERTDASVVDFKLSNADIVFVGGGNLEMLMNAFKTGGTAGKLREAYERGCVMCGSSSGAMCWFERGYDDCGVDHSFVFVDCLGFLPYVNCPHYQSENWQTFADAIKSRELSGIACDNGAAICCENGRWYTVSGNEDGDCYFYDAEDGFKMTNLNECPEKLSEL